MDKKKDFLKYIIITPAKNESEYIEKTINSVIRQTVLPHKWIIVDDGSTDSTSLIVKKYLDDYPCIRLVQREKSKNRNFENKVFAIRSGFQEVQDIEYNFYCNLDADVSFEPHYFETLMNKFEGNPKLGICGGQLFDFIEGKFYKQKSNLDSVGGPVQFFRRECYESFGGYQAFTSGFIDGHAEISARMNKWITRTFPELRVNHYRPAGIAKGSRLKVLYEGGKFHYRFGYLYIYHLLSALSHGYRKPYLLSSLAIIFGYLKCLIRAEKRIVNHEFVEFLHKEQWGKIKNQLFFWKRYIYN